jgi:hypothetical protein
MPLPNLGPQTIIIPFVSYGWAVGSLFIIHILIVAFIMGTAWILVFTGSMPLTPKFARFERFTRTMARWLGQIYSLGATFAVFAITVVLGLYPREFSVLVTVLGLPVAIIFAAWLVQTLTLLFYYATWNRLRPANRWAHQALITLYAIAETVFIVMITLFTSYQVTPPATPDLTSAVSNPTWFPEALHRVAGNLSYAGFLIAAWGAYRYWRKRRSGTSVDKTYYHWVAHLGFFWAVGFELAQLPIGTYYVFAIQAAGPQTYTKMMLAAGTSAEWLLQILLVSILFVLTDVFAWSNVRQAVAETRGRRALQRMRELAPAGTRAPLTAQQEDLLRQQQQTAQLGLRLPAEAEQVRTLDRIAQLWTGLGLWILLAAGVLAVVPSAVPVIGSMNAKWLALGVFLVWSAVTVVLYFLVSRGWTFGNMPRLAMWSMLSAGVCVTVLMVTMGIIRYTNPQTAVIEHQVPLPAVQVQSMLIPQP